MRDADDVTTIELKVAEVTVGRLRMRNREGAPDGSLLRLVTTLIASEVERVRAPERASEEAATSFQRAVLERRIRDRDDLIARGKELGTDLAGGGSVVVVRAHPRIPTEDDWRRRLLARRRARRARRLRLARSRRHRKTTVARWWCWFPTPMATRGGAWPRRSCASSSPGWPVSRSRSVAAAGRRNRSICSARATRRCSRSTSSKATRSVPNWRSTRPGPTSCCSRT